MDAAFAEVKAKWGRLDLLFNNAGGGTPALPIDELSVEQFMGVVGVNLIGSFLCARAAFSMMRHQIADGRAHHQQRLDLGAHAAAGFAALHHAPSTRSPA